MKKKILVILVLLLIVTGCGKKKELIAPELEGIREKVVEMIGKTNDKHVVIKFEDANKYDNFYVYEIENQGYTKYQYILYPNKEKYNTAKSNIDQKKYSMVAYDDSYTIRLLINKYTSTSGNIKDEIINNYKDLKKYTIIN
jgi:hypothetical protein